MPQRGNKRGSNENSTNKGRTMCTHMSNCPIAEWYHMGPLHKPEYTGSVPVGSGMMCGCGAGKTQKAYGTMHNTHQRHHMPRVPSAWCYMPAVHGTLLSVRQCVVHGAWGQVRGAWCCWELDGARWALCRVKPASYALPSGCKLKQCNLRVWMVHHPSCPMS